MTPAESSPRHNLLEPGFLAAFVTWLAVFSMTWLEPGRAIFGLDPAMTWPVAVSAAIVFVVVLVVQAALCDRVGLPVHGAFIGVLAVSALAVSAGSKSGAGPILLIIVMAELAARCTQRVIWSSFAALNVVLFLVHWEAWNLRGALIGGFSYAGFQLFAIVVMQYAVRAERTSMELREVNAHLLATRSLLAESARDQERLRIARELHDVAGHKLTALKLQLRNLVRQPGLAGDESVRVSVQLADELLADMRAVVQQMREHDGMNLRAAIEGLVAPFPRPKVSIDIDDAARVDTVAKADAIVRAVQEALTNAARHGDAEHLWIRLSRNGDRVEVEIRDDGRNTATPKPGNGLLGMSERFREVGGAVVLDRPASGGFSIHAWVPVA